MAKINISISDELLDRIDFYAKENYITRSGCIAIGMAEYLNNHEVLNIIKNLGLTVQKIADTGVCDTETMKELEDFERMCKLILRQR